VSHSSVTDCVAYLSRHALPIRCPRYSPEELSERLPRHGATYSPETLLAACTELGWPTPTKKGRVVLGMTLTKPRPAPVESGDGEQVISSKMANAMREVLEANGYREEATQSAPAGACKWLK
jgi:hypothetical protein